MVPADIYDAAVQERDAFRKTKEVDAGSSRLAPRTARDAGARRHHAAAARRDRARACSAPAIPGAAPFASNLTLWVGMLGAAIAAREGKLLTLATGEFLPKGASAPPRTSPARSAPDDRDDVRGGASRSCSPSARPATRSPSACPPGSPTGAFRSASALIALRLALGARRHLDRPRRSRARDRRRLLVRESLEFFEGRALLPWLIA